MRLGTGLNKSVIWAGCSMLALSATVAWAGEASGPAPSFQLVPPEQRLHLVRVVEHALPLFQVVMVGMVLATIAAIVLWAVCQLRLLRDRSSPVDGALAFLSGLVVAAPLFGAAIAAYTLLHVSLGIANLRPTPSLIVLAPGFAEGALALFLGLLTAAVASVLHAILKASRTRLA